MRASSHLLRTAGDARTRLRVAFRGYASASAPTPIDATKSIERESGCLKEILVCPELTTPYIPFINRTFKDRSCAQGISTLSGEHFRRNIVNRNPSNKFKEHMKNYRVNAFLPRIFSCNYSSSSKGTPKEETRKDMSISDDPFDPLTSNIPEKPVTFVEGASYSVIIFAGLGVAALAIYAVFKELIFQPKEYKIFGKALERVQNDNQVTVRIGSPVTGYGNQSRNRAARQRIHNRVWTDEDGVEHVEVVFYIRGPHGAGKVYTEMFEDQADKSWKYMFLIVEITDPSPAQLMLESYIPA